MSWTDYDSVAIIRPVFAESFLIAFLLSGSVTKKQVKEGTLLPFA